MTFTGSAGSSGTNIVHRGEAGTGPFMLTLCRLVEPVSIRPPQSPHLKPFTFFTSRAREPDGSEQLYLHMGFFETLTHAEKWARAVRGRHPEAIATITPPAFWQLDAEAAAWRPDSREENPNSPPFAPVDNRSLTDTQVINILRTRHPAPPPGDSDAPSTEQIELLRPDDTGTRRALREAVIRGAPVSFAVQLHWSARSIDTARVPPLPIFKAFTLYAVESRRASGSCHFLRLGFFPDPVSAKRVAAHLRTTFTSAAVIPVLDEEIARAREACTDTSAIPCLVQQRFDQTLDFGGVSRATGGSKPETGRRRGASRDSETLEQTLAELAEREMWSDTDSLSDTGVRHIKVEVQGRTPRKH